jgi:hypothetical protein
MRRTVALLAGVVWLVLSQAGAAFASVSGPQSWVVVSRSGQPTRVAAYGIVNAVGTVTDVLDLHLESGTFDNLATQTFPDGTLLYHGSGTAVLQVDPRTCVGTGRFVGPFLITGGTGRYANATGSGVAIGDLGFLFAHTTTGCSQFPVQFWGVARATGQLTLS